MSSHFNHAHTMMCTAAAAAPPKQTDDITRKQQNLIQNLGATSTNRMRMDGSSIRNHHFHHQSHHIKNTESHGCLGNQTSIQRDRWERDLREVIEAQEIPLMAALRNISATSYDTISAYVEASYQQQKSILEQCQQQHKHQKSLAEAETTDDDKKSSKLVEKSASSAIDVDIKLISSIIASDLFMHSIRTGIPWTLAKRQILRKRREARLKLTKKQQQQPQPQQLLQPHLQRRQRRRKRTRRKALLGTKRSSITTCCLTGRVRGLPNHGQTCFLNSVLQALASLNPFVAYLERIVQLQEEIDCAAFLEENATTTILEDEVLVEEVVFDGSGHRLDEDWEVNENGSDVDVESDAYFVGDDVVLTLEQEKELRQKQEMRVTPLLLRALRHANDAPVSASSTNATTTSYPSSSNQVDTRKILNRVAQKHSQFQTRRGCSGTLSASTSEQQDAQELLQALMSVVISEAHLDVYDEGNKENDLSRNEEGSENDQLCEELGTPQQHSLGGVMVASGLHKSSLLGPSSLFSEEEFMMFDQQHQVDHTQKSPHTESVSPSAPPLSSVNMEVIMKSSHGPNTITSNGHRQCIVSNSDSTNVYYSDKQKSDTIYPSQSITLSDSFFVGDELANGVLVGNGDGSSNSSFTSTLLPVHQQQHCDHKRGFVDDYVNTKLNGDEIGTHDDFKDGCDRNNLDGNPEEEILTFSSMLTKVGQVQRRLKEESCKLGYASGGSCSSFSSAGKINEKEQFNDTKIQKSGPHDGVNEIVSQTTKTSGPDIGQNPLHGDQASQEEGILILDSANISLQDAATATTTSTTNSSGSTVPIEPLTSVLPSMCSDPVQLTKTSPSQLSVSMQMMIKTLSSITPSPLNGWSGSNLQCCSCNHTSPIQNAPFLEIPVVPTSISHFQKSSMRQISSPYSYSSSSPLSPQPACTLDECLSDFTAVEKVHEVDCRACAIKAELENLKEDGIMLRGAIRNISSRKKTNSEKGVGNRISVINKKIDTVNGFVDSNEKSGNGAADDDEPAEELRRDLDRIENRIQFLEGLDPDDGDFLVERDRDRDNLNDLDDDQLLRHCCPRSPETDEEKKCDGTSSMVSTTSQGMNTSSGVPKAHRGDANKRLLLTRLPPILCLHAKRLFYDPNTDRMAKSMQHITFQEYLDLSAHCAYSGGDSEVTDKACGTKSALGRPDRKPIIYRLMSVIEHRGNAYAGHYLTYRRIVECGSSNTTKEMTTNDHHEASSLPNEWAMASDDKVSYVSWHEVSQCQAYMLFYEAI